MITTTGIYHIGIPVNDVERAVKFYTEVLGMKIAKLNRDDMGDHLNRADLRSGDGMVVLFQRPTAVEKDALKEDGAMVDDFLIVEGRNSVHVLNAPSPAATASIPIGNEIARRISEV